MNHVSRNSQIKIMSFSEQTKKIVLNSGELCSSFNSSVKSGPRFLHKGRSEHLCWSIWGAPSSFKVGCFSHKRTMRWSRKASPPFLRCSPNQRAVWRPGHGQPACDQRVWEQRVSEETPWWPGLRFCEERSIRIAPLNKLVSLPSPSLCWCSR